MVYVKKIFLVPPLESLILHRILTFCGFFRSKQNGSSKWEQRQEGKRTVPMASTRAASILQKSQGFKDRKPALEPLFYHFLTLRPWPNHNFPRRHFLFMMEGNAAVGTNSYKTHGGFYTDVKYIIFIMGLYTSWFATRDKDPANGSLNAGNSPRLGSRSINSRFRKNIREFETDIKRVKSEQWGDKLPGSGPTGWHWATFLTSACHSLHTLGIIVAKSILISHSRYIVWSHHRHWISE